MNLYDRTVLDHWRAEFDQLTKEMFQKRVLPYLKLAEDKDIASKIKIDLPYNPPPECGSGPFVFCSSPSERNIILPLLSLKFLYDITFAYVWRLSNDCSVRAVYDYVSILRYKPPEQFVTRKYPRPFDVLQIPHLEYERPRIDNAIILRQFRQVFETAVLFILAHEVAHIILKHVDSSVDNEKQADMFALHILSRNFWDTSGAVVVFGALTFWGSGGRTHPLNGERLRVLGVALSEYTEVVMPHLTEGSDEIKIVRGHGRNLISFGQRLDDASLRRSLADKAAAIDVLSLAACRPHGE